MSQGLLVAACGLAYDDAISPPMDPPAPMPRIRAASPFVLVLVLVLTGCGQIQRDKQDMALESTLSGYRAALRWGYYETAWGYLHPELREAPLEADWVERVRVVGYDVVQDPVMADETTATQVVQIDYVDEEVQRMHSLADRQVWRYDPDGRRWWLHSGLPAFR
ncbi:hypothetical protein CKO22_14355 [Thiococcus pfennigii]|nr:hypothetical protein [Thiococcus pfennigii]